jgi:hypothetical protein
MVLSSLSQLLSCCSELYATIVGYAVCLMSHVVRLMSYASCLLLPVLSSLILLLSCSTEPYPTIVGYAVCLMPHVLCLMSYALCLLPVLSSLSLLSCSTEPYPIITISFCTRETHVPNIPATQSQNLMAINRLHTHLPVSICTFVLQSVFVHLYYQASTFVPVSLCTS